jgi:hypothetical protein
MQTLTEESLMSKLVKAVPSWALGAIGTLLTLALVLKIVGIDFAQPINGVTMAYVEAIERQSAGMEKFDTAVIRIEAVNEATRKDINSLEQKVTSGFSSINSKLISLERSIDSLEDRVLILENDAHPPSHSRSGYRPNSL